MLARPMLQESAGLSRTIYPGDLLVVGERVPATNAGTAVTLTGALLSQGIYLSSGAGAVTLTLDSAANIVAALANFFGYNPNAALPAGTLQYQAIPPGTAFRFKVIISTANAVTVAATANTGVTVNRGSVAASSSRDFLVTFTNGTLAQAFAVNSTNASAVLSGLTAEQLSKLSVGMVVTNAALNLQAQTIISINLAAGTVTMSGNANATTVGTLLNFSPTLVVDGL